MASQDILVENSMVGNSNGGTNNRYFWTPPVRPVINSSLRMSPLTKMNFGNFFIRAQGTGNDVNKAVIRLDMEPGTLSLSSEWETNGSLSVRFQRSDTSQWLDLTNSNNPRWRSDLNQAHRFNFPLTPVDTDDPYRYEYASPNATYTMIDNLISWFNQIRTDEGTSVYFNIILTLDDNQTSPKLYAGENEVHSIMHGSNLVKNVYHGVAKL